jgi:hypothetical protein
MELADCGDRRHILSGFWLIPLVLFLAYAGLEARLGRLCAYMGTDFRGYYSSGQIIWQRGFADVYDQAIQSEFQAGLRYACPEAEISQPAPLASVPYLPVFLLLLLPLPAIEFTVSYLTWAALNLLILLAYLVYFMHALDGKLPVSRFLQWLIILPVLANFYLGQSNLWLVICLGEFFLAQQRHRRAIGGLWLAGLALKPHTLVLLIPGLVLGRQWRTLAGFSIGLLALLAASALLGGEEGILAATSVSVRFAGSLIQTVSGMINLRALVFNLEPWLPGWLLWGSAIVATVVILLLVGYLWIHEWRANRGITAWLLLATLCGSLILTWHSHFYLLMMLLPLLMFLDSQGLILWPIRALWSLGPLVLGLLFYLFMPEWVRPGIGISYFALCLFLMLWSASKLQSTLD